MRTYHWVPLHENCLLFFSFFLRRAETISLRFNNKENKGENDQPTSRPSSMVEQHTNCQCDTLRRNPNDSSIVDSMCDWLCCWAGEMCKRTKKRKYEWNGERPLLPLVVYRQFENNKPVLSACDRTYHVFLCTLSQSTSQLLLLSGMINFVQSLCVFSCTLHPTVWYIEKGILFSVHAYDWSNPSSSSSSSSLRQRQQRATATHHHTSTISLCRTHIIRVNEWWYTYKHMHIDPIIETFCM